MDTIFGMEMDLLELDHLLRNSAHRWVNLFGAAGAGKTFLARFAADRLWDHFRGEVYWITLGKSPCIRNLQLQLLTQVTRDEGHEPADQLQQVLVDALSRRTVLLVLDSAWDHKAVSQFDVVSNDSKILVTSQRRLQDSSAEMEIQGLSEEASRTLFCKYAGLLDEGLEVSSVYQQVCDQCWRLPLLLKIVGAAFALQVEINMEWELDDSLEAENKKLRIVKIGYDALVAKYGCLGRQLQLCLLLLAAFPDNTATSKRDLVKCWKGEGILDSDNVEQEVGWFLEVLVKQALVEVSFDGCKRVWMFSLHDVVRDMLLNLVPDARACLFEPGKMTQNVSPDLLVNGHRWISLVNNDLQSLPETIVLPRSPSTTMLLLDNNPRLTRIQRSIFVTLSNLRVLSLKATSITQLPFGIGKLANLTVLDISYSRVEYVPATLRSLSALEFLDMSHCYHLKVFPPQVFTGLTKLYYLNTEATPGAWNSSRLDHFNRLIVPYDSKLAFFTLQVSSLKLLQKLWIDTDIRISLPSSIGKLVHLKLLHVYSTQAIKELPSQFLSLMSLEDLRMSPLAQPVLPIKFCERLVNLKVLWLGFLEHLWELPWDFQKLSKLRQLKLKRSSARTTVDTFAKVPDLRKLELTSFNLVKDLSVLSNLKSLRVLHLINCTMLQQLPPLAFPYLKELFVHHCSSLQALPALDKLPRLKILSISSCNFVRLPNSFGSTDAFPCLDTLWLSNLNELVELPELQLGALPKLRVLVIKSCDKLAYMNQSLPQLEELRIQRCRKLQSVSLDGANLVKLDLSHLQFAELPRSLTLLPWLRELELEGCVNICELPYLYDEPDLCYPSLEQLNIVSSGLARNCIPKSLRDRKGLSIYS